MRIKRFEILDLLGRPGQLASDLNEDINIMTGRNGAGKTSLLKLLWYVMSGNISLALQEIPFAKCRLITDSYDCTIHRLSQFNCKIDFVSDDYDDTFEDIRDDDDDVVIEAEEQAKRILMEKGSSVFFSTFRRIEGGYTLSSKKTRNFQRGSVGFQTSRQRTDIDEAFSELSRRLSNGKHQFVSAISTGDIDNILLRKYSDYSAEYNELQQKTSDEIISTIKAYKSDRQNVDAAERLLDVIRVKIETMEDQRETIMAPITAVRAIVEQLIKHTGIVIGSRLSFGDAANAVNSDLLSAGEKQIMSFICYNAFYRNSIIFIDEPELSLHVDWQRQLFHILASQKSSNQFIIATHSPFIYSKYPDKEIAIDLDKGDSES